MQQWTIVIYLNTQKYVNVFNQISHCIFLSLIRFQPWVESESLWLNAASKVKVIDIILLKI